MVVPAGILRAICMRPKQSFPPKIKPYTPGVERAMLISYRSISFVLHVCVMSLDLDVCYTSLFCRY